MSDEWVECTIEVPAAHGESVANFLIESGAPGLQAEERDGIVRLTAYFAAEPPLHALVAFCGDIACPLSVAENIQVRSVPDEDWGEDWRAHFQPQLVGARLFICPPWDRVAPPGRVAVVIDPGMAFGTGQHATTRGCLLLLERVVTSGEVTRALDVGTGSGVLAIALAKLGVRDVWAADTDASACAIAEANAVANGVKEHIRILPSLDGIAGTFAVVTANLFANLLEEMSAALASLLQPGGVLICSGFLSSDEQRVRTAYESRGLRVACRHDEESWVTLGLQRLAPP